MIGNKRDKNKTKKSRYKSNSKPLCDCFHCLGRWENRWIEKARARLKHIKHRLKFIEFYE